jgi:hypothetical protein
MLFDNKQPVPASTKRRGGIAHLVWRGSHKTLSLSHILFGEGYIKRLVDETFRREIKISTHTKNVKLTTEQ